MTFDQENIDTKTSGKQEGCCSYDQQVEVDIHDAVCCSPFLLLLIRVFCCAVLAVRFYLNIVENYESFFYPFKYLTHFGFMITFLFYVITLEDFILKKCSQTVSIKLKDRLNLMFQIALSLEVVITGLYWTVVYSPSDNKTTLDLVKNIGNHGFPLICLIIDFCLNLIKFPRAHLLPVYLTAIFYLIINLIYTLVTKPIYSAITWKSTSSYIWVVVALAVVGLIHVIGQVVWYHCKRSIVIQRMEQKRIISEGSYS